MRLPLSVTLACSALLAMLVLAVPVSATPPVRSAAQGTEIGRRTSPELNKEHVDAWLDGFMDYALKRGDVAGGVVIIVKDGKLLTQRGFGFADVSRRIRVDPDRTVFFPASVSKLFTWAAVMQLVEQGKLDLDRDINTYLDFTIPPAFGKPITMRHLMTHTAGFEEQVKNTISSDRKALLPLDRFLKRWIPERIYTPGTTPAYSNYGAALAGYIVQRASGEPYARYVARHILQPLGMRDSTFYRPLPPNLQHRAARGYDLASGAAKPEEFDGSPPAGGLAATGTDMARFMTAFLPGTTPGLARILRPETIAAMFAPQLEGIGPLDRMGLGFYETRINGRRVLGHGGDSQWFHSGLRLFVDDGIGIFMSFNSSGRDGSVGAIRVALLDEFANEYLPVRQTAGIVDINTARQHAAMMAGTYESTRAVRSNFLALLGFMGQITVRADRDGKLTVTGLIDLNDKERTWREIAPFVWREENGYRQLAAQIANGRVTRFGVDGQAPIAVSLPVPWWRSSAWLIPAAGVALLVLVLTVLAWPISAVVRRNYGAALALDRHVMLTRRLVRLAALAVIAVMAGWILALMTLLSDFSNMADRSDWWLLLLETATLITLIVTPAVAAWNIWTMWRSGRHRWSLAWNVAILLSVLVISWIAILSKLMVLTSNY